MKEIFSKKNIASFVLIYLAAGLAFVTFAGIWNFIKGKLTPGSTTTTTPTSGS